MAEPRIEETGHGSWMLVGDLSFTTVPALRGGLDIKSADRTRISIDLAGVTRSDSAGLALLIEWLRESERLGKTITFLNMPAQMQSIARVCGLDGILPADTVAAATIGSGYRTSDRPTTTPGDSPAPKSKSKRKRQFGLIGKRLMPAKSFRSVVHNILRGAAQPCKRVNYRP